MAVSPSEGWSFGACYNPVASLDAKALLNKGLGVMVDTQPGTLEGKTCQELKALPVGLYWNNKWTKCNCQYLCQTNPDCKAFAINPKLNRRGYCELYSTVQAKTLRNYDCGHTYKKQSYQQVGVCKGLQSHVKCVHQMFRGAKCYVIVKEP